MVRGDHRVNEIKLGERARRRRGGRRPRRRSPSAIGPPGFIGPVGARRAGAARRGRRAGALRRRREPRATSTCAASSRAATSRFERADVRAVEAGDLVGGHPITIEPAIEVGNIFQLGTRYSKALGATYLDEQGAEQLVWMGSYGIGMARIAAAAVEQFADERGISWPAAIAPFAVHLVGLGQARAAPSASSPRRVYATLREAGVDVDLRRPRRGRRREVRRRRAARGARCA